MRRIALGKRLVADGLASSLEEAEELIARRLVLIDGAIAMSSNRQVSAAENVGLIRTARFVSRGGEKLAHALEHFGIDVSGLRAADVGSSTGGFTDCLLQHGAISVTAIDTGRNLLHERLRQDPRVIVLEGRNARMGHESIPGTPFDVVVVDVSFISVRTLANSLATMVAPGGTLVVLVKPQFEATRAEADRSEGVITDTAVHERVVAEVSAALEVVGFEAMGLVRSPITGQSGNVEFLLRCRRGDDADGRARLGSSAEG